MESSGRTDPPGWVVRLARILHEPRAGLRGQGRPDPVALSGRAPAVLALHGFGGTPREVDLVVEVAREQRLAVHAPLLAGHGATVAELAVTRYSDWYQSAAAALATLAENADRVVVVGLSMGSLLASRLAAQHPDQICGLVLLANAFWLPCVQAALLRAWDLARAPDIYLPKGQSNISDPLARSTHLSSAAQPIHAAIDLWRAGRSHRSLLAGITVPVLVAHGGRDRVCPPANALRVLRLLRSASPQMLLLPRSGHILTRDLEHQRLRTELRRFLVALSATE